MIGLDGTVGNDVHIGCAAKVVATLAEIFFFFKINKSMYIYRNIYRQSHTTYFPLMLMKA